MTENGSLQPSRTREMRIFLVSLLLGVVALWALSTFPIHYNPDANAYFGMTLRFSAGNWWGGVHLMHSPLIALLLVPLIIAGFPIPISFHIVTAFIAAANCFLLLKLATKFSLSGRASLLVAAISTAQILPFAIWLITPDFLVSALTTAILIMIHSSGEKARTRQHIVTGVLIGVSYLAKSSELPIWFTFLFARFLFRSCRVGNWRREGAVLVMITGAALLISLPWIAAISAKGGSPLLSGQQLVLSGQFDLLDYHPDVPLNSVSGELTLSPVKNIAGILKANAADRYAVLESILTQFLAASFSVPALLLVIAGALWMMWGKGTWQGGIYSGLFGYAVIRGILYLSFGGPYARFYLPLIGIANIILFAALERSPVLIQFRVRAIQLLLSLLLLIRPLATLYELSGHDEDPALQNAFSLRQLYSYRGELAGNLDRNVTGYIAYSLGRESWGYVDRGEVASGLAIPKLQRWQVRELLWLGDIPAELSGHPSLTLLEQAGTGDARATLFSVSSDGQPGHPE